MEYEIDGEGALFDNSTNPSLEPRRRPPLRPQPAPVRYPPRHAQVPAVRRKAVVIPEEEQAF